ncbi:YeiH family protein [Actomonas aquatica]|uniref:Sulfate exporter family transporter n=1 Tax=Actomonas aquatica TaxID=2866162 RepID=A0ABZ1CBL2_9BACT|nr:putative sulfate exporter family transporter [Opitutus sp. WL0086]WRQ89068.1 putative sulfate exporter family transporter [Opitutus sp. WL0086]
MTSGATPTTASTMLPSGLLLAGVIATLVVGVPPWLALLAGMAVGFSVGAPTWLPLSRATHLLLKSAVVGIGAGLNLAVVARVGVAGLGYTAVSLLLTGAVAFGLIRWLGVKSRLGTLIMVGTAICGGSAIAAVAPVIRAENDEISASLATVFLLNAVALLLFPVLGAWTHLAPEAYGLWCALAIHDTSSVVGASLAGGEEALAIATTVKLARALWIVPVALGLGLAFRGQGDQGTRRRVAIPWFIGGFLLVSALFTWLPGLSELAPVVVTGAKRLLTLSLFLVGVGMSWQAWRQAGLRALQMGVLLWFVVCVGTYLAIRAGWIA